MGEKNTRTRGAASGNIANEPVNNSTSPAVALAQIVAPTTIPRFQNKRPRFSTFRPIVARLPATPLFGHGGDVVPPDGTPASRRPRRELEVARHHPAPLAQARAEPARASVLLLTQDLSTGRSYVAALERATVPVEWVRTAAALRSRLVRDDLPRPALVMVLPSGRRSLPPSDLASVALRLTAEVSNAFSAQEAPPALQDSLNIYASTRLLSRRQRQVLELYLIGNNDKEIADSFRCSATTVYEHWRRMAKKANGAHKSDVVNDFHRFLATRAHVVKPSSLASPRPSIPPSGP
jgi:DNA-binding CsgD family transcriptional regulator